jgi:hypothetical protein
MHRVELLLAMLELSCAGFPDVPDRTEQVSGINMTSSTLK